MLKHNSLCHLRDHYIDNTFYLGVETQAATRVYFTYSYTKIFHSIQDLLRSQEAYEKLQAAKRWREDAASMHFKDYLVIEAFDVICILGVLRFTVKWFTSVSLGLDPKRRRRCTSAQAGSLLMQRASACFSYFVLSADHFVRSYFFPCLARHGMQIG